MAAVRAWTVSQLTAHIKAILLDDEILRDLWIEGEVSNFVRYSSGHCYFSLKDAGATLQCVMWKSVADTLVELPENGQHVLAHGYISVYEPRGAYQFYVDYVRTDRLGDLQAQFEALKAKLAAEGLFAAERKRPLPPWPRRIGVVTSPHGAALRDIVRVIRTRFPGVEIILSPTAVQGAEAPGQIVQALHALFDHAEVDVIVVARGGGSLEDLWAFNDEQVARTIAASPVPVVSGVGHETDFTIADFVADVRAATPSAAAMAVVPDGEELQHKIRLWRERLQQVMAARVQAERRRLDGEVRALQMFSPQARIDVARQSVDDAAQSMQRVLHNRLALMRAQVEGLRSRLGALNPLHVLARGYAIAQRPDGRVIASVGDVEPGEHMWVRLRDGRVESWVVGKESISNNER